MRIALCLLTWNEIDGVKHDIPLLDRSKFDQLYCVDGGSKDGTVEYLEQNGITVYRQKKRGINGACLEGVAHCKCDAFVFYHPKGTIPIEDIYKFRKYFEDGYEFVVGSRMMAGAHNEEDEHFFKPRKWFVLGTGLLAAFYLDARGISYGIPFMGFAG